MEPQIIFLIYGIGYFISLIPVTYVLGKNMPDRCNFYNEEAYNASFKLQVVAISFFWPFLPFVGLGIICIQTGLLLLKRK